MPRQLNPTQPIGRPPRDLDLRDLKSDLHQQLMSLSFHGFEHAIHKLLTRMGYSDVQILSRRSWKGRAHHGGRDMDAFAQIGVTRARVIVQAKQYRRPVQRRFVDELRGVMLRTEASQAILVSTSFFPGIARATAQADTRIPVRLIDGAELLDLLIEHGIGARRRSGDGELVLDEDLFNHFNRTYPRSLKKNRDLQGAEPRELHSKRFENSP